MVLGWDINTVNQVLALPQVIKRNIYSSLAKVPPREYSIFKRKLFHLLVLLVLLRTVVPVIAVSVGFSVDFITC